MAVVFSSESKYSFKYVSTSGNESASRTIGGLNISSGTSGTGPDIRATAVDNLITVLQSFTNGVNGGYRWLIEQEVTT